MLKKIFFVAVLMLTVSGYTQSQDTEPSQLPLFSVERLLDYAKPLIISIVVPFLIGLVKKYSATFVEKVQGKTRYIVVIALSTLATGVADYAGLFALSDNPIVTILGGIILGALGVGIREGVKSYKQVQQ